MTDQPYNVSDRDIEGLQKRVEDLRLKVEARERIERIQLAQSEAQATAGLPGEVSDRENFNKLIADKSYDASTQAHSIIDGQAPATTEAGMDKRAEAGPEFKDLDLWAGRGGPEGKK
jgi:hypothetical protein